MEMTRDRISFTFDPRDMLVSLQIGFGFVRAAVVWAILERTSGFESSSEISAPRYLKLVTVPASVFHRNFPLNVIGAVCRQFGLLSTDLHLIPLAGFVETWASSFCSSSARASLMFFQSISHNPFEKNVEKRQILYIPKSLLIYHIYKTGLTCKTVCSILS